MKTIIITALLTVLASVTSARDIHVSTTGDDRQAGTASKPLRTISAAAQLAQPGDTITVREGLYREQIAPPRGGTSDKQRIVYRAAPGEHVVIKGSERITAWRKLENDTWQVTLPNTFFGDFNPYSDLIHGDWFNPLGRQHHTGAVYLNDHWLIEAASLDDVLKPVGAAASSYGQTGGDYFLNVAWFRPLADAAPRIQSDAFKDQQGVQTAPCSEGNQCIGWVNHGDWVRYESVDFGAAATQIEIRAASVTTGGIIEIRLDKPDGKLLGSCSIPNTGGWQSWSSFNAKITSLRGKQNICLLFKAPHPVDAPDTLLWFAQVDPDKTTIWAQFKDANPNNAPVEINVRRTVFYPDKPFVNYITVRGFTMTHAATPWAPPTAEQPGLIGTHWSKGWIIEDNDISCSTCVGVALGKHGDRYDNTSQDTATGYVDTINRALANRWSKADIGSHVVRNNHISHCEQAGVVGSLGAAFSTITGNTIHDIHVRRLFTGAEMAGIKIHAAIDTVISDNHIYRCCRGIWLDWMAQGTRVTRNLLHDNAPSEDLFMEVDHGPFMIDHNVFLSPVSLLDVSEGGAYVHNLFTGRIAPHPEPNRDTPYHKPHSTELAGLKNTSGGDDRFYNNIFVAPASLAPYDSAARPVFMAGNVFLKGAQPSTHEKDPLVSADFDPAITLTTPDDDTTRLAIELDSVWLKDRSHPLITTEFLGRAAVPDLPYELPDGSPCRLDTDYFDKTRNTTNPFPGPFEITAGGKLTLKVWP
jgi:hypothetical protein